LSEPPLPVLRLPPPPDDARLDQARLQADPLADDTIARLLGAEPDLALWQTRLSQVNAALAGWQTNADVEHWQAPPQLPADMAAVLRDYLGAAQALPAWADIAKIHRAEKLFYEEGVLSCLLLFCASLPECYVVPDLAEVLQATAQLEERTEHRIRATAGMIFPIMLKGGLSSPEGSGRAQILKVRLIHATVRHLLLRGRPDAVRQAVPALEAAAPGMHAALFAHGWDLERDGLPCNQEELAYTLLTFGYVGLRSLHRLGVPHRPSDEEAILHTWNLMGSLVGVAPELMAGDMAGATALFERLQARGLQQRLQPDPRPPLARALMACMTAVIPLRLLQPMPLLLTRFLLGRRKSAAIGLRGSGAPPAPLLSKLLFWSLLLLARGVDSLVRLLVPGFSISRLFGRLIGYRLLTRLLMDQTRPLRLPEPTRQQLALTVAAWGRDPKAPRWLNQLEDRYTMAGDWRAPLA
jgi:ER-bound oxygenase mpaB/B'/Rubber oxygenase, catalytic domain